MIRFALYTLPTLITATANDIKPPKPNEVKTPALENPYGYTPSLTPNGQYIIDNINPFNQCESRLIGDVKSDGLWKNGILIFGSKEYKNGIIEEGPFVNDLLDGKICKRTYPSGSEDEGVFDKGVFTNGTSTYGSHEKTISKEVGPRKNFRLHGEGTRYFRDGLVLSGTFEEGQLVGEGIMTFPNGVKWIGHFKHYQLEGVGEKLFSDNWYQKGLYRNGELIEGEYQVKNGDFSKGTFINEKLNGMGEKRLPDGEIQKGFFKNDILEEGEVTLANGSKLVGTFKNNRLHGKNCTFRDTNGQQTTAQFEKGIPTGKGTIQFPDGTVYKSRFKQGKLSGYGTVTSPSNTTEKAWFIDGQIQLIVAPNSPSLNTSKTCRTSFASNETPWSLNMTDTDKFINFLANIENITSSAYHFLLDEEGKMAIQGETILKRFFNTSFVGPIVPQRYRDTMTIENEFYPKLYAKWDTLRQEDRHKINSFILQEFIEENPEIDFEQKLISTLKEYTEKDPTTFTGQRAMFIEDDPFSKTQEPYFPLWVAYMDTLMSTPALDYLKIVPYFGNKVEQGTLQVNTLQFNTLTGIYQNKTNTSLSEHLERMIHGKNMELEINMRACRFPSNAAEHYKYTRRDQLRPFVVTQNQAIYFQVPRNLLPKEEKKLNTWKLCVQKEIYAAKKVVRKEVETRRKQQQLKRAHFNQIISKALMN